MEIRVLQYFLAVAREQSISGAAKSLNLSQPTLSTQLKALEEELGKPLLIRGTKGSRKVTLTEEGMLLRKRAEEIVELAERTRIDIQSSDVLAGEVAIGSAETDTFQYLADIMIDMSKQYPDILWKLHSANSTSILERIDKGLLDFGLTFDPGDSHTFNSIPIPMKDTWGILVRQDSPLAQKETILPQDLIDIPLILPQRESARHMLEDWLQTGSGSGHSYHIFAQYNLIFNAAILVDHGAGAVFTLDTLEDPFGKNLVFIPLKPKLQEQTCFVWKKYQKMPRAAGKFLQEVMQKFSADSREN